MVVMWRNRWSWFCLLPSVFIVVADNSAVVSPDERLAADDSVGSCRRALEELSKLSSNEAGGGSLWDEVGFSVHRNGEPEPCGFAKISASLFQEALTAYEGGCDEDEDLDKFQVESLLTFLLAGTLEGDACGSTDDESASEGLTGFCDMGPERTVIQLDHEDLVVVPTVDTLPCRMYTREGLRISSLSLLTELAQKAKKHFSECTDEDATCPATLAIDLYAVPAGRMFMFAPSFVGEKFILDHVQDSEERTVSLEVLSVEPRVFDIINFFNRAESDALIEKALNEKSETYGFHRSTTGTVGASVFARRTSENAWDTHGKTALLIKQRCFRLLGLDEYIEGMSDGLQILRYNLTTAYVPHMDYLSDAPSEPYNYDSSTTGGNRYATILLYMSDMEEGWGGETVFPEGWPPELAVEDRVPLKQAIKELRESGDANMLEKGSWQEQMVAKCRTRLAVRPHATRAVLFYSQLPNGEEDPFSNHGGCPVLNGTKLAANLWTWSAIRPEYDGAPLKFEKEPTPSPLARSATFHNLGKDPRFNDASVYYDESGFFGNLGPGQRVSVNTYVGHTWNIKNEAGEILKTFVIEEEPETQVFQV